MSKIFCNNKGVRMKKFVRGLFTISLGIFGFLEATDTFPPTYDLSVFLDLSTGNAHQNLYGTLMGGEGIAFNNGNMYRGF